MNNIIKSSIALICTVCSLNAKADNLWIIGDALPGGWSLDRATALLSTPETPNVYTGTIYLKAGQDFKFMTYPDWGNEELGAAPGAILTNGNISLAKGSDDNGYNKIQVSDNANYLITVDTQNLTAKIEKSIYQQSEITLSSLFMVGSATVNGWTVMQGMPLYQNANNPVLFESNNLSLNEGSFKIATTLKGAESWNPEFWYFRDANDSDKIALNQEGDLQWDIPTPAIYTVSVNLDNRDINITKNGTTDIENIQGDNYNAVVEYYTLTGIKVSNPTNGLYIKKIGSHTTKLYFK